MYRDGDLPANVTQAATWFLQAAYQGFADAQYAIGLAYEDGHGVPEDDEEAVEWYSRAADQGHANAQNRLDQRFEDLRQAAEQGGASAQRDLGLMYRNGRAVPQDFAGSGGLVS